MKREKAIDTINILSSEFEPEDLLEKLIFEEKIEKGLMQLEKGKTIPLEKVKKLVKKW